MKPDRLTRINELLRREIGECIFRLIHENQFDLAAVTITHVFISSDLRTARVLVSIRCPPNQRPAMLALLQRHRPQIQEDIARKVVLKYTPRLSFALDTSLEEGDRVLNLLSTLDPGQTGTDTAPRDSTPVVANGDSTDSGEEQ